MAETGQGGPDPIAGSTPTPPVLDFSPEDDEELVWRHGKLLVMSKDWAFDDRCIKCGAPAGDEHIARSLYWHLPILYLTLLGGIVLYVVLALVMRKEATIYFAVCPAHRREHWKRVAIAWFTALAGLGATSFAIAHQWGWVALGGLLLLLGAIVYSVVAVAYVKAKRIDDEMVWILGCGPVYLAPFPEWK